MKLTKKDVASVIFGSFCGVSLAWLYLFHIEIFPSGYARLVYEEGDLLHWVLKFFNFA